MFVSINKMSIFQFKKFSIRQEFSSLKVGTDAMVLGAFIDIRNKRNGLDIGTGTGVLALMQVQKSSQLNITAIELDEESCFDADYNFLNSEFTNQLTLEKVDFLEFSTTQKFDLIFSNPPFYQNSLKAEKDNVNLAKHVAELTPHVLFKKVSELLKEKGDFWVIWPYSAIEDFKKIANEWKLFVCKEITINGKVNDPVRMILCFKKSKSFNSENQIFTIREMNGDYTEEYKKLTLEFHDRKL